MYNILVIGAGQIGSRHLQGLAKIDIPIKLLVIDPNQNSIETAKKRFSELPQNQNISQINFCNELKQKNEKFDLVIIATNSDVRFEVTKNLVNKHNVQCIVFEKIVFQREKHFEQILHLLHQKKIKAWVNCPRRLYDFYMQLKDLLKAEDLIYFSLTGGEWGMGCNSVHFLDLICYLSGTSDINIDRIYLDPGFIPSKRPGFFEFTGRIEGRISEKIQFRLHSQRASTAPISISLSTKNHQINIFEKDAYALSAVSNNSWIRVKNDIKIPFQSELTQIMAKQILTTGESSLAGFEESYLIHKPLLKIFTRHYNTAAAKKINYCPIT
jgi:hypothetical protein